MNSVIYDREGHSVEYVQHQFTAKWKWLIGDQAQACPADENKLHGEAAQGLHYFIISI
jgi:hypothetical protein